MSTPRTAPGDIACVLPLAGALAAHKTTALLKSAQLEVIRIVLLTGKVLPDHAAPGEITVQCLEGCIEFTTPQAVHLMRAGDLIHLRGGERHALKALEDSSALLTMCLQGA